MPRPERLLDPTAGPLEAFAHDLRTLRRRAGNPSYRAMAKRAHYSVATLAEAARGLHKPSLKVTLAYVTACGGDPEMWTRRWHSVSRELEGRTRPSPDRPAPGRAAQDRPRQAPPGGTEREPPRPASATPAPAASPAGAARGRAAGRVTPVPGAAAEPTAPVAPARTVPARTGPARTVPARTVPVRTAPPRAAPAPAPGPPAPATGALTGDERAELRRLRDEVEELRRTNEVLKAASAIFAADLRTTAKVVYNPAGSHDRSA
ncbi:helix-turn-helix domain-containing protein [Streptomyces sp. NPDC015131]|uniref:helix-turn-helix domain-containing protein n=1 Tax=Streptomyces sp. NPDC015131 TaxID=3364941 RepID=UPI0036FE3156